MRRSRSRGVLPKIGALLVASLLCVALGELLVRSLFAERIVLFPRFHTGATYGDFELRRLRPNSRFRHTSADGRWDFTTNAQGFRDTEDYSHAKSPELLRVVVLGDSHTEGFEVRQSATYPEVAERALIRGGRVAQVMNTGISGFSTAEALVFLEQEGVRYEPDVVVLGLFANDFDDNVKAGLFALDDGELRVRKRRHVPGVRILDTIHRIPGLPWLSQHSYLYSLGFNTAWSVAKNLLLERREAELATEYAVAGTEIDVHKQRLLVQLVQRLFGFCRDHGIALIIVDIPQISNEGFSSSIPEGLQLEIAAASDAVISSEAVFGTYRGVVDLHVPRGQQHINEFAHAMLGVAAARAVEELLP
ncbi:MAG: hypothetical protein HKP27_15805 [Myxococcales bacterium]|nr:hypothetical protein [Myxococcales bacterium]